MPKLITRVAAVAALLFAGTAAAQAQSQPSPTAYTGPRFPGGPDSLRALFDRSTRFATPGTAGRVVLQFELLEGRQPRNFKLVAAPGKVNSDLKTAAQKGLAYLEATMPAWTPGTPDPDDKPGTIPKGRFVLDFINTGAARPYAYPDQEPVFPDFVALLHAQHNEFFERVLANPARLARLTPSFKGLVSYIQMQVRYPPAALRQQQQGTVSAYFEVAENGAIEHAQILGTAGDALDDEVTRIIQTLPAAIKPALVQGRPVRMGYIVPVTFKIQ
jgi:protein TonB